MQLSIRYGTKTIKFDVEYRDRKTMQVSVEPPDKVFVVAPLGTSERVIENKVRSKAAWIVQKLYSFRDMEYRKISREYVNGESFMYFGRNYSLQIQTDKNIKKPEVQLYRGKFHVTAPSKNEDVIKQAMEQWYREKTQEKVLERVQYYQHFFKKRPADVKVKEQQKRWASCTSKDELLFNWRCVMAPSHVLDYIVVHEMCHMYYKNHSQEFWDMLASIMPDYKRHKEWLKKYGVRMDL
ncbi:M48 family metallopeptidase [Acetivibrio clariflavus]|uniref:Putative metal-dependent hydrolase n=1 Tax=Acetivibrio clariflavus (strain DSM 19732 / NBRC 101661 / EBR45) TaxID=720554 RepID=G8LSE5_ACECE|nr:SprT family zinc-dependent metalloprotease [Acetivibrio clariflavus]AEV67206.1 putative metal-dependent hydrolase [Acetivibrio clariflavus DSM 19732]